MDEGGVCFKYYMILNRLSVVSNQFLSCKTSSNIWKLVKQITGGKHVNDDPSSVNVRTFNDSSINRLPDVMISNSISVNNDRFSGFDTDDVLKCFLCPQSLSPNAITAIVHRKCDDALCYPPISIFNELFSTDVVLPAL
uniref:Uncharacterized protein n=1 Tax=Trichobilharzia regenti TaxID=157069 RepID=A0AA85JLR1_TRIRE|nr:unnamed protein product [Trichobilharzia regenti]